MNLIVNFDQPQSSLPAGFVSDVDYVVNYYDQTFTANVTVTIDVGYGELDGQPIAAEDLGESEQINVSQVNYSAVVDALIAENAPGAATLPASPPAGNPGTLYMATAEQKALGLLPSNDNLDGYIGFADAPNLFSYTIGSAPPANEYYFVGVVEHEISEVMGRTSYLDYPGAYSLMDLFRYAGADARQFTTGAPSYFSIDGGVTDLNNWNNFQTGNGGDLGDWAPSAGNDAYDDNSNPGIVRRSHLYFSCRCVTQKCHRPPARGAVRLHSLWEDPQDVRHHLTLPQNGSDEGRHRHILRRAKVRTCAFTALRSFFVTT